MQKSDFSLLVKLVKFTSIFRPHFSTFKIQKCKYSTSAQMGAQNKLIFLRKNAKNTHSKIPLLLGLLVSVYSFQKSSGSILQVMEVTFHITHVGKKLVLAPVELSKYFFTSKPRETSKVFFSALRATSFTKSGMDLLTRSPTRLTMRFLTRIDRNELQKPARTHNGYKTIEETKMFFDGSKAA